MKTVTLLSGLILALSLTACNKNSSNQFILQNGLCFDAQTGQSVSTTYCGGSGAVNNQTASGHFTLSANQCWDNISNTAVDSRYCTTNPFVLTNNVCTDTSNNNQQVSSAYCNATTATTGTALNTQCVGNYVDPTTGYFVTCSGNSCSGHFLVNLQGIQVYCP